MSEEIMLASADMQHLAAHERAVELAKDEIARLTAARDAAESALGTAHAEITRLEQAMRHAARGISIRSARKRIREALGE